MDGLTKDVPPPAANPFWTAVGGTSVGIDVLPAPAGRALAAYSNVLASNVLASNVLVTLDRDSSLATTRGWDDVTGIGSLCLDGYKRLMR